MKKLFPLLLLTTLLIGCRKSEDNPTDRSLYGTWELRQSSGFPLLNITYPPGNGSVLIFRWNGQYYWRRDQIGNIVDEEHGSYKVSSGTYNGLTYHSLSLKSTSQPERKFQITIKDNRLTLSSIGLGDAYITAWEKL